MTYTEWQARHPHAAADLQLVLAQQHYAPAPAGTPESEDYVQSAVRLEAAHAGVLLWRNNVGAFQSPGGAWVRYGLANDSKQVNARIKSADLIGVRRVTIMPQHVGTTIGQLVSREVKHAGWQSGESPTHEAAQFAWAALLSSWGADARIVSGPGSF